MRIGIITECYRPTINGVVFSILNFKRALEEKGHEVLVFAPVTDQENGDKDVIGCRMVGHPAYPGYGFILPPSKEQCALVDTLDLLHTQHPFVVGRYALTLSHRYHKPLVFTNHTQYGQYSHYVPLLGTVLQGAIESYVNNFVNQCDLVIAPSEGIKRHLDSKRLARPVKVVPNGIDINRFANQDRDRSKAKEQLNLDPDTRVILYSGRIALEKNLGFLLDSFKALLNKTPDVRVKLVVAGSGPQENNFRHMAAERNLSDNVVMLGGQPHDDMPKIYRAADIFATASKTEVHPLTIIEALASGLPVVAVKAMGVGDIVTHGEDGLLVDENVEDFSSALARLLNDTDLWSRLSKNGPANAARFSIENSVTKLLAAYDLAIAEHAKRSCVKA